MAKSKGGKSKGFVSQGVYKNVSNSTKRLIRSKKTEGQRQIDQQRAWLNGSNPWVTIDNPNKEETNKRKIRVRMNDLKGGSAREIAKRSFKSK